MMVVLAEDDLRVYAYEHDPTVWALDRLTGALLWAAPMEQSIHDVAPLADGSLAVARAGGVVRLDGEHGRELETLAAGEVIALAVRGTWLYTVTED